jgi:hypothetical protein
VLAIPAWQIGLQPNIIIFCSLLRECSDPATEAAYRGRASQMTHRMRRELLVIRLIRLSGGAAGADGRRVAAALLVPA